MKIFLSLLLVSLFLLGCHRDTTKQSELVHQLTDRYSENLKKKEDFHLSLYGGVYYPKVCKLTLGYDANRKADLPQARKLIVQYVSKLLDNVNESEELRPFLDEYPYSAYGVHFVISFFDKHGQQFHDGSIARVSLYGFKDPKRANVVYYTFDPKHDEWPECYRETYEEAEEIVRGHGPH